MSLWWSLSPFSKFAFWKELGLFVKRRSILKLKKLGKTMCFIRSYNYLCLFAIITISGGFSKYLLRYLEISAKSLTKCFEVVSEGVSDIIGTSEINR